MVRSSPYSDGIATAIERRADTMLCSPDDQKIEIARSIIGTLDLPRHGGRDHSGLFRAEYRCRARERQIRRRLVTARSVFTSLCSRTLSNRC